MKSTSVTSTIRHPKRKRTLSTSQYSLDIEAVRKKVKLSKAQEEPKLQGCFSTRFDRLLPGIDMPRSPDIPQEPRILPLEEYTDLPEGLSPMPMPRPPVGMLAGVKTRAEKAAEEAKRQREIVMDIYCRAQSNLLQRSNKFKQCARTMLMANGRSLNAGARKIFRQVLKKKTEGQRRSTLNSPENERLFRALLLASLKSVVVDPEKADINLWKVGRRFAQLQRELSDERNKDIELAKISKLQERECNRNTYDRKRFRLGKVLPPAILCFSGPRDISLRNRTIRVPNPHQKPNTANPQSWPGFTIKTVFKQETGSIPRACGVEGEAFSSMIPAMLGPVQKRYGVLSGYGFRPERSKMNQVLMAAGTGSTDDGSENSSCNLRLGHSSLE